MIGLKRKNVNLSIYNNKISIKLKFDAKKGQFVHILLVPPYIRTVLGGAAVYSGGLIDR